MLGRLDWADEIVTAPGVQPPAVAKSEYPSNAEAKVVVWYSTDELDV
jgi:hypothetical protein